MTTLFPLPDNHPQRFILHNEVNARSSVILSTPVCASHLALVLSNEEKITDRKPLHRLRERFGVIPPESDANHFIVRCEDFQLRWKQHGECSSYTFYVNTLRSDPLKAQR